MVIFFDIDGTILDDGTYEIPESAYRAIRKLQKNGHIALVNTGRPYSHVDSRVLEMGFRGWVCSCGLDVILDGQKLNCDRPSREAQQAAVDAARKYNLLPLYEVEGGSLLYDGDYTRSPAMLLEVSHMADKGLKLDRFTGEPFIKHIVFYDGLSDVPGYVQALEPYYTIIYRANNMLELVKKGASKAAGMQIVLDHLHMTREETMAVGDSTNDLPMFQLAGHTVCMGGGMEELKAQAEYITDEVMNDGLEKALQHYGLI